MVSTPSQMVDRQIKHMGNSTLFEHERNFKRSMGCKEENEEEEEEEEEREHSQPEDFLATPVPHLPHLQNLPSEQEWMSHSIPPSFHEEGSFIDQPQQQMQQTGARHVIPQPFRDSMGSMALPMEEKKNSLSVHPLPSSMSMPIPMSISHSASTSTGSSIDFGSTMNQAWSDYQSFTREWKEKGDIWNALPSDFPLDERKLWQQSFDEFKLKYIQKCKDAIALFIQNITLRRRMIWSNNPAHKEQTERIIRVLEERLCLIQQSLSDLQPMTSARISTAIATSANSSSSSSSASLSSFASSSSSSNSSSAPPSSRPAASVLAR